MNKTILEMLNDIDNELKSNGVDVNADIEQSQKFVTVKMSNGNLKKFSTDISYISNEDIADIKNNKGVK